MSQTESRDDWDKHWHEYAQAAEFNPAKRYRSRLILSLLGLDAHAARVLDIGSGQGDFAAELRAKFPQVGILGLELSRSGCELARRKVPNATFVQRDLLEPLTPEPGQRLWATHAVCSEVLEHVDRPDVLLANAAAYMAPGCRVVVTVPGGPMSAFDKHIGHRRHFNTRELRQLLEGVGFEVDLVTGAGFPFHTLYRLVVILRGRTLVTDAAIGARGVRSKVAHPVMRIFGFLFRFNLTYSRLGWQLLATARTRN